MRVSVCVRVSVSVRRSTSAEPEGGVQAAVERVVRRVGAGGDGGVHRDLADVANGL